MSIKTARRLLVGLLSWGTVLSSIFILATALAALPAASQDSKQPLITPTPTSEPGPPILLEPEDGALLPQPVPPDEWRFLWSARTGPCHCHINISGPGGRSISAEVNYWPDGYQYIYTQTQYLPEDALTPWYWSVDVHCPDVGKHSETWTFSVMPAPVFDFQCLLPFIVKDN